MLRRKLTQQKGVFQKFLRNLTMETVTFPSKNKKGPCPATLYGSVSEAKFAVIVLQEWWGVTDEIRSKAKEVSKRCGCVALVPDLYRGAVTEDYEEAGHWMETLDWSGAVSDIQGAATYLNTIQLKKVGVTGYCMGGGLSLTAGALIPEINAAAPFYGLPKQGVCDLGNIRIPIQAHFAEQDTFKGFSSPEDAHKLEKTLSGVCDFQLYMYPAGHAFADPNSPRYNKECCELAMLRLTDFFLSRLSS